MQKRRASSVNSVGRTNGYFDKETNSIYMKAIIKFNAFLTGLVLALAICTTGIFAAPGDATKNEQSAAAVAEAERLLAEKGYWIAKVDGVRDDSTRQAILAFQKVEGLKRTGILNSQILESIRTASRPTAKFGGEAHIEIDISRQVILLVDDAGIVTNILSTSTGSGERYFSEGKWQKAYTPLGTFKITRQIKGVRKAPLGSIYYPSYFHEGWAIHGSNSVPATPASHGCARIPRFADKQFVNMVRVGMTVHVYK